MKAAIEKVKAISPDLIAALQVFGDKALAEKMAESMAPLTILGGEWTLYFNLGESIYSTA